MRQFKVINQLEQKDGVLMCKKRSGRSYQKAHYRQGDLDGACGAYSIAMVLNIIGVFEADEIYSNSDKSDNRFAERRLIKALNEQGLYRDGLNSDDIQEILYKNYSKYVYIQTFTKEEDDISEIIKDNLNENAPVILRLGFDKQNGHWVVVIGYETNELGDIIAFLTLDPSVSSPTFSLWNGVLNLEKEPRKKYGYLYYTGDSKLVDFDDVIVINKN